MMTEEQRQRRRDALAAARAKLAEKRAAGPAAAPEPEIAVLEPEAEEPQAESVEDILSQDEIAEIYAQAKLKVRAERKKLARDTMMKAALEEEMRDAGIIPPETEHQKWLAETVQVTISLPPYVGLRGRRFPPDPIRIDQRMFHSGHTYSVPRAQAMTLYAMMGELEKHAKQVQGDSGTYYDGERTVYRGGPAAGSGMMA